LKKIKTLKKDFAALHMQGVFFLVLQGGGRVDPAGYRDSSGIIEFRRGELEVCRKSFLAGVIFSIFVSANREKSRSENPDPNPTKTSDPNL
jgi:hypothetical protein